MGQIYRDQTALKIILDTELDLSSVSVARIKYIKPQRQEGFWVADIESPATAGLISFTMTIGDSEVDQSGSWTFWAYLIFGDGSEAPGEAFVEKLFIEGK